MMYVLFLTLKYIVRRRICIVIIKNRLHPPLMVHKEVRPGNVGQIYIRKQIPVLLKICFPRQTILTQHTYTDIHTTTSHNILRIVSMKHDFSRRKTNRSRFRVTTLFVTPEESESRFWNLRQKATYLSNKYNNIRQTLWKAGAIL